MTKPQFSLREEVINVFISGCQPSPIKIKLRQQDQVS
uniref:Uncharacterized protein n=1 Tax=Rhizophora mucronata TaxID=61149 RepID=A0A2P2NDV2_RHIMU